MNGQQLAIVPGMTSAAINRLRVFEALSLEREQVPITTHHLLHAGMYHRTIMIPADVVLTGALIKRATTLTIHGDATVATGGKPMRITGYQVIPASAHRKQAFIAHADTWLTMAFPTQAKTVEEAEAEFTDEAERLFSRHGENIINITGE